jgi:hypothetical protein
MSGKPGRHQLAIFSYKLQRKPQLAQASDGLLDLSA